MNIGEAASRAGLPAKTIRYYESIGLVGAPARTASRYRRYSPEDIRVLAFLQRARSLGFTVEQCRELLALYRDEGRASADVRALAQAHLRNIERKIAELESLKKSLEPLVAECQGDDQPACPILDALGGEGAEP